MTALTVEFVDFDDERTVKGQNDPALAVFADALRAHPGRWAKWPKPLGAASSMAVRINYPGRRGTRPPAPISAPEFEARTSQGVLYVRCTPGDQT